MRGFSRQRSRNQENSSASQAPITLLGLQLPDQLIEVGAVLVEIHALPFAVRLCSVAKKYARAVSLSNSGCDCP
jgi:hypothetical protein